MFSTAYACCCPHHTPTAYEHVCCGFMVWTTKYAVEHIPWRTMSMFPTPYAYGVGNTYPVDDMFYAVETYSVGIHCGNNDHMLWGTYAVGIYCGRHSISCGEHKCKYTVGLMLWTTSTYDVGNIVVHSIYPCYPQHITHGI